MQPALTKHLGIHNPSQRKLIVLWREVPADQTVKDMDTALVVFLDKLTEPYLSEFMAMAKSTESQKTDPLANAMINSMFRNGSKVIKLLHEYGHIQKIPAEDIDMHITATDTINLRQLNYDIAGQPMPESVASEPLADAVPVPTAEKTTVATVSTSPADTVDMAVDRMLGSNDAQTIILMARNMEKQAKALRVAAYKLEPALKKGGKPAK